MDNNEAMRDYLKRMVNQDIILKYLYIKSIEDKYSDEHIKNSFKLNTYTIRSLYNGLDETERNSIESELKRKIDNGEINLEEKAKEWQKEALIKEKNRRINEQNSRKNPNYKGEVKE